MFFSRCYNSHFNMKTIKWWTTLDLIHCYCCVIETKTKRIILVNHNRRNQTNQIAKQIHVADTKPGKACASEWRLVWFYRCSWGHVTTIFQKIFYIMGYNLKNARNGKSISKIPKWQSLRSLAYLRNDILWWFEFQKK